MSARSQLQSKPVADLRSIAESLGIEHKGLQKAKLIDLLVEHSDEILDSIEEETPEVIAEEKTEEVIVEEKLVPEIPESLPVEEGESEIAEEAIIEAPVLIEEDVAPAPELVDEVDNLDLTEDNLVSDEAVPDTDVQEEEQQASDIVNDQLIEKSLDNNAKEELVEDVAAEVIEDEVKKVEQQTDSSESAVAAEVVKETSNNKEVEQVNTKIPQDKNLPEEAFPL